MTGASLSAETEATLLLCGSFGSSRREESAEPLTVREFNTILDYLERHSLQLSDLVQPGTVDDLQSDPDLNSALIERTKILLNRGTAMALAIERWIGQGFWVLDRTDPRYPERFHKHLGKSAPPLLYGAGEPHTLNHDRMRIAVVGSRDIDEDGEAFARALGSVAAQIDAITVSGGARGADRAAINGALEQGGTGIAILPGALEQVAMSRAYRQAISEGRFTVISPFHPRAKFTVGNAMHRNRLIYCLADVGIVVDSAEGSGGTWSGATETLKYRWVPVAARETVQQSNGNTALLAKGAVPITPETLETTERFSQWLTRILEEHRAAAQSSGNGQLGLFPDT
jgi:predicted Rossmann fold nucleotide-binding protein DprA/Smf involved in DNA uptake